MNWWLEMEKEGTVEGEGEWARRRKGKEGCWMKEGSEGWAQKEDHESGDRGKGGTGGGGGGRGEDGEGWYMMNEKEGAGKGDPASKYVNEWDKEGRRMGKGVKRESSLRTFGKGKDKDWRMKSECQCNHRQMADSKNNKKIFFHDIYLWYFLPRK